ncbi:MAG: GDSL-type esterase/lipase family protein [Tenuifilaceae bacterium]|jgi:lysophospholipase L1-like esterase|nr:GDSL-type esterase/lipase family protein [Tenuifilaceae bacterium]
MTNFTKILPTNKWIVASTALVVMLVLTLTPKKISLITQRMHTNEPLWFINFEANVISHSSANYFPNKFSQLVEASQSRSKPLTILHIGDSHVQADVFTGETRRLLASWLNDDNCARGVTFPHQIVGSNNPDDFTVTWKGSWKRIINSPEVGIFGVTAQSANWGSEFSIRLNSNVNYSQHFDRVRIFFDSEDANTFPYVRDGGMLVHRDLHSATYQLASPTNSVTIGNSIGKQSTGALSLHGVELVNTNSKLLYHAAGVNGASIGTYLRSNLFASQVSELDPAITIVSLGTNDAYNPAFCANTFRENLKKLISKLKSASPNSMLILTTPGDHLINRIQQNESIEVAQRVIREVAQAEGCGVWDFFEVMGGAGSIEYWAEKGLCAPDMLHLNRKGYRLKGALLFEALTKLGNGNPILIDQKQLSINE